MSRVLIVEDEAIIRGALRRLLERNGYEVLEAGSVEEARALDALEDTDIAIADLRLPGAPGTDVIDLVPRIPVLIMTSYASVRSAVSAMKRGAADYIVKPFDHDEMLLSLERMLAQSRVRRQNRALRTDLARAWPIESMVGECAAMREVFSRIDKVAGTDATVLVTGESGTGKELVARALHERSARRSAPMITVNCAAIPVNLVESELFGHEKGAFTGAVSMHHGLVEAADGGTLFLDEIGELPLDAQSRLLRVLETGEVRPVGSTHTKRIAIRLIAATHRDLRVMVEAERFRDDLYFRLHVMEIELPPLRDRGGDIVALSEVLLARSCERLHKPPLAFGHDARQAMVEYPWPGNVRELEHAIERAVILAEEPVIGASDLALPASAALPPGVEPCPRTSPDMSLEDYFRTFVGEHQGRMSETELAGRLGISRKALWERRRRLGIPRPKR